MGKLSLTILMILAATSCASAKNFTLPDKDPVMIFSFPNDWETDDIKYGFEARSPDDEIYVSIETPPPSDAGVKKYWKDTEKWMKSNNIVSKSMAEKQMEVSGAQCTDLEVEAKDEDGPTQVSLLICPLAGGRAAIITLWASEDDQKTFKDELGSILSSIKFTK